MGVTSPSSKVRARKQAVQRTAERAVFAREQARQQAEEPPVEEEAPPEEGEPG